MGACYDLAVKAVHAFNQVLAPNQRPVPARKIPEIATALAIKSHAALDESIAKMLVFGDDAQAAELKKLKQQLLEVSAMSVDRQGIPCWIFRHRWTKWIQTGVFNKTIGKSYEAVEVAYVKLMRECAHCGDIQVKDVEVERRG